MKDSAQKLSCWNDSEMFTALWPSGTLPCVNCWSIAAHSIGLNVTLMPTLPSSCCSSSFMGIGIMFPDPDVGIDTVADTPFGKPAAFNRALAFVGLYV